MEKTWKSAVAGILDIVSGGFSLVMLALVLIGIAVFMATEGAGLPMPGLLMRIEPAALIFAIAVPVFIVDVLAIVGGVMQEYRDYLEADIAQAGLNEQMQYLGAMKSEDVLAVMKASRVFVFPSYEEGWGIAICEAMACGLPVVAYDLPVYREIYGDSIWTVPVGDSTTLALKVCYLLEDPMLVSVVGMGGHSCVAQYDWDLIAARELEMFNQMLQEAKQEVKPMSGPGVN